MEYLLFPLRLKGAPHFTGARGAILQRIERSEMETSVPEREAVVQLIRMMAETPNGSWKVCPHFGFRNFLVDEVGRRDALDRARDAVNKALEDLGIKDYRLKAFAKHETGRAGEVELSAEIVPTEPGAEGFSIALSAPE